MPIRLGSLLVVGLLAITCLAASCDKLTAAGKNIPGKYAGRVMDSTTNSPRGYITIAMESLDGGHESYQMTTEDNGSFFFDGVVPGRYDVKVMNAAGDLFGDDVDEVYIGPGRTITQDVNVTPPVKN